MTIDDGVWECMNVQFCLTAGDEGHVGYCTKLFWTVRRQNTLRVRCIGASDDDAITDVTTVYKQNGVSYVLLSFQLLNSNFINFYWLRTNFS